MLSTISEIERRRLPLHRHADTAQGAFSRRYRDELNVPFIMGVGGALDVLAGHVQACARHACSSLGLEWLYRVYQEPRPHVVALRQDQHAVCRNFGASHHSAKLSERSRGHAASRRRIPAGVEG